MIKNYFKTAWRNLVKSKTFSFINKYYIFAQSIPPVKDGARH